MTKRRPDPAAFARDVIKRYPVVLEHLRASELQDKARDAREPDKR
ncbi:hypothetical protein [Caulobacter phage KcrB]|nr:hypothetical protein RW_GP004c [Caulobacter phage RW]WCA46308.1 hypothetical protein [Caulobacter phage KcrB]WCD56243.1 hypothetical protein [Caulobacter phage RLK]WNV48035.1 hypothetical protein GB2A_gp003c [Caulobacter phage GB2A]QDH50461.1 hypothetical protein RW_GP100c [Caulobacter phage RW]